MYYICIRVYNRYEKMRRLSAFLLCLAIVLPISAGKRNDFELKRGINMSHWLSQGYARGRMREQRVTEADFRMLKEFGFDHVRIPIDEEQFWDEHGIAWTMWNYDSGFGFVNSRTHQVADQRLLDILTGGKGL